MNREIKFRAFTRNIIVDVTTIDFKNKYITWFDGQYDRCIPNNKLYEISRFDEIELMQFTGLKDKNGVQIYEGDILEYKNELGRHHKHTVFMVDGGLAINSHQSDFGKETPFYEACADNQTSQYIKQCSVIGNIYEHPNLLTNE